MSGLAFSKVAPRLKASLAIGSLAILGACTTTVDVDDHDTQKYVQDFLNEPLKVPPLSALPQAPKRHLKSKFTRVNWNSLPGWNNDDMENIWLALVNNCKGLMRPVSGSLTAPTFADPRQWHGFCLAMTKSGLNESSGSGQIKQFLQDNLNPWRLDAAGKQAQNTVTGYYEPVIHASREKGGDYQWPLYAVPEDLLTIDLGSVYPELTGKRIRGKLDGDRVVPYDTRAQIAAKPERQPKAIVWANDPVEAFFLQIQGSGQALLPNGESIRLAYANHNGQPYASIGKWLAKKGEMPISKASMQNIKAWAKSHPERVQEMLNANPAVVFFEEQQVPGKQYGPNGAYGIPLIAGRAIAVDPEYVPLGTPVFLATNRPGSNQPLQKLVFAQDTGAAIKGAARADFYWGTGDTAGQMAGRMKQNGKMWVLLPK